MCEGEGLFLLFCHFNHFFEYVGFVLGELGEYLSVKLNIVHLESVGKLRIGRSVGSCSSVYLYLPQRTARSLFLLAALVRADQSVAHSIYRDAVDIFSPPLKTAGVGKYLSSLFCS